MKKKKTKKREIESQGHHIHVTVSPKLTMSHAAPNPMTGTNDADKALHNLKYKNFKG